MRSVEGGVVERENQRVGCFADAGEGKKSRSDRLSHVLTVVASELYAGWYLCSGNGRGRRNGRVVGEVMVAAQRERGGVVLAIACS
jgi:hypothetical protein